MARLGIYRAFSLTELLVVMAIVALLAALLFPVLVSVRQRSKEPACMANLKQLHAAIIMYMDGNNDTLPTRLDEVVGSSGTIKSILKCTSDSTGGANIDMSRRLRVSASYFYLHSLTGFREALQAADANHGLLYCVLHGTKTAVAGDFVPIRDTTGLVLRLRRDGSVQRAKVGHYCSVATPQGQLRGRQEWSLLSDTKCVGQYCFGLTEPCP